MAQSNDLLPYDIDLLPLPIGRYLEAQVDSRDRQSIVDVFTANARVTDQDIRYDGVNAISRWLSTVATEFTYTTTPIGQRSDGPDQWVVRARLEGDFPGGVADLNYRFTIQDDQIKELLITL